MPNFRTFRACFFFLCFSGLCRTFHRSFDTACVGLLVGLWFDVIQQRCEVAVIGTQTVAHTHAHTHTHTGCMYAHHTDYIVISPSHLDQLSLLPYAGREISNGESAVMLGNNFAGWVCRKWDTNTQDHTIASNVLSTWVVVIETLVKRDDSFKQLVRCEGQACCGRHEPTVTCVTWQSRDLAHSRLFYAICNYFLFSLRSLNLYKMFDLIWFWLTHMVA